MLEFLRTVAGEDQVAVAVDEAGDHAAAARVDALVGIRSVSGIAEPGDMTVLDHDRGIVALRREISGGRVVGDEKSDVVDEGGVHERILTAAASSSTQSATRRTVRPSGASLLASTSVKSADSTRR